MIIALALFASLAGCAKPTGKAETTQLGRITAIDGTGVTLALGEWTASDAQEPPQKPDSDTAQDTQDGTAPTPPSDASNGGAASTAPGNSTSDATAPDSGGNDVAAPNGEGNALSAPNSGGSTDAAHAVITIEEGCAWEVTGDCTITSLSNAGTTHLNGHTITLADGTVLR